MTNKQKNEKKKKANAEKPISLFGAKFEEVLGVLLKTKPKPKEKKTSKETN